MFLVVERSDAVLAAELLHGAVGVWSQNRILGPEDQPAGEQRSRVTEPIETRWGDKIILFTKKSFGESGFFSPLVSKAQSVGAPRRPSCLTIMSKASI